MEMNFYVRTEYGDIAKLISIDSKHKIYKFDKEIFGVAGSPSDILDLNDDWDRDVLNDLIDNNRIKLYLTDLLEVGDIIKYDIPTGLEPNEHSIGYTDISNDEILENIKKESNHYKILSIIAHERVKKDEYKTC